MTATVSWIEPPEGSIIGWGSPMEGCVQRCDTEANEAGYAVGRHWFGMDNLDDPWTWDDLTRNLTDEEPYLLVRQAIAGLVSTVKELVAAARALDAAWLALEDDEDDPWDSEPFASAATAFHQAVAALPAPEVTP
jgi:hypothetical protein